MYRPLDDDQAQWFLAAKELPDSKIAEFYNILTQDRIIHMLISTVNSIIKEFKLPIIFSARSYVAMISIISTQQEAVIFLYDYVTKFKSGEITFSQIVQLYPNGFYDENHFSKLIIKFKEIECEWVKPYFQEEL